MYRHFHAQATSIRSDDFVTTIIGSKKCERLFSTVEPSYAKWTLSIIIALKIIHQGVENIIISYGDRTASSQNRGTGGNM